MLVQFALYAPLVTNVTVFDGFVYGSVGFGRFFAVLYDFFFRFALSNIPQRPPPQGLLKEIDDLFCGLLWDNKHDKMKRSEMINGYEKVGLKLVDIKF